MSAEPGPAPGPPRQTRRAKPADPFRLMADFAPVMIWRADPDRRCVYVNRAWLEFTGRLFDDELGPGRLAAIHESDRPAILAAMERAYATRSPFEAQYRLRRRDGEYRWLLDRGAPLVDGGKLVGFVGACLDTTERLHAEAAARDQLLGIVSHELRSPLNGIKSWTHVLESQLSEASPSVRRALAGIMTGVEHQVRLIEDLLLGRTRAAAKDRTSVPAEFVRPRSIDPKGARMKSDERKSEIKAENERTSRMPKDRPERGPEPDTLEGPGYRQEAKGESDAVNKTTRLAER